MLTQRKNSFMFDRDHAREIAPDQVMRLPGQPYPITLTLPSHGTKVELRGWLGTGKGSIVQVRTVGSHIKEAPVMTSGDMRILAAALLELADSMDQ